MDSASADNDNQMGCMKWVKSEEERKQEMSLHIKSNKKVLNCHSTNVNIVSGNFLSNFLSLYRSKYMKQHDASL